MGSENENKNLEVEMGKLTVQIDNLNKNFEGLSKSVPDILNRIDSQTGMLIKLIEQKDENYRKQFVNKDVYDEKNKSDEKNSDTTTTRIEKIEGLIQKLSWSVIIMVIVAVGKLVIK